MPAQPKTWLNSFYCVEFPTEEDCLIFWAFHFDEFYMFNALHHFVTHRDSTPERYAELRAQSNVERLETMFKTLKAQRRGGGEIPLSHMLMKAIKPEFQQ